MARILIVDDEPDILQAFRDLLATRLKADVETAASGPEALAILADRPFDLLVADHRMPGISGIELIAQAKARLPQMRCVLFTAYRDNSVERRALEAGADLVLSKSGIAADFAQRLRDTIGMP